MAHWIDREDAHPKRVASGVSIGAFRPVIVGTVKDEVLAVGSAGAEPLGVTVATNYGNAIAVQVNGVAKCIAVASLGAGVDVGVASTNGAVGPIASAANTYRIGVSTEPAAAGQTFSVFLRVDEQNN
jgi:hypothetical protein